MGDSKIPTTHRRHLFRLLSAALLLLLFLLGLTSLILFLIYRPSKPLVSITSISIYSLSSSPSSTPPLTLLSTSIQLAILFRNPSHRATVLYDRLSAYVSYRGEPITPPAAIPPFYQETDSSVSVAPVLGSGFVPVSGDVVAALHTDRAYGVMAMRVVVLGRVKYKSGPFRSRWNGLYVACDVLVGAKKGVVGPAPMLGEPQCKVNV